MKGEEAGDTTEMTPVTHVSFHFNLSLRRFLLGKQGDIRKEEEEDVCLRKEEKEDVCLRKEEEEDVCLKSKQNKKVFWRQICFHYYTMSVEVPDQVCYTTQSQYTNSGPFH